MRDANVLISAVKYDRDRKHIEYLRVHLPVSGVPGPAVRDVRRESVVDMISRERKTVLTVFDDDGTWVDGAEVLVTAGGFLRTVADAVQEDNLGELPEMDTVRTGL
jgi:hypothetical protein